MIRNVEVHYYLNSKTGFWCARIDSSAGQVYRYTSETTLRGCMLRVAEYIGTCGIAPLTDAVVEH